MTTLDSGVDTLADVTSSEDRLRRFLLGLPGVDQVGAEAQGRHP